MIQILIIRDSHKAAVLSSHYLMYTYNASGGTFSNTWNLERSTLNAFRKPKKILIRLMLKLELARCIMLVAKKKRNTHYHEIVKYFCFGLLELHCILYNYKILNVLVLRIVHMHQRTRKFEFQNLLISKESHYSTEYYSDFSFSLHAYDISFVY